MNQKLDDLLSDFRLSSVEIPRITIIYIVFMGRSSFVVIFFAEDVVSALAIINIFMAITVAITFSLSY